LYVGYPIIASVDEPVVVDALLTGEAHGVIVLSPISSFVFLLDDPATTSPLRDGRHRSAIESSEELDQRR
jgi:hypothetical protein